jgi:ficolin
MGRPDGKRVLNRDTGPPFYVWCHKGYIVMQKRTSAAVWFNRSWRQYSDGFGDEKGKNLWLGNQIIHRLMKNGGELVVELLDDEGTVGRGIYSNFTVLGKSHQYMALFDDFAPPDGTEMENIGDSLQHHHAVPFSTFDREHDSDPSLNCADAFQSGWWFTACFTANPNGLYRPRGFSRGIVWSTWRGYDRYMKMTRMLIKPRT